VNEPKSSLAVKSWPDYRAFWRWHFYAGLFCIPFVLVLASSGSIYLFKTEIESLIDRPYDHLTLTGPPARAADHARSALTALPGSSLQGYELPQAETDSVRVIVRHDGEAKRVYVHPTTLQVLHIVSEEDRFMRQLFKLHGELWIGNRGSTLVELAASWTIIMIVTGLVLWWPRGANRLAGVLYPRLGRGSRLLWRDLHGVTGMWISGFALFLLLSGLPWAKFWGDHLKTVRHLTGTAVARQDWTNGATPRKSPASGEHAGHGSMDHSRHARRPAVDLKALDRVVAAVRPLHLPPPVVIAPPGAKSAKWTAKSLTPNRPKRVDLVVDGTTGAILDRNDFRDRHVIDRVVGTGIAIHEGRFFGLPNQLLGVTTAAGLILLCVSSVILWWRRRESGVLGAPRILVPRRVSFGLIAVVVLFGLYLPLFGLSLVAVLLLESLVLRRIPVVRDWLGLQPPIESPAV